MVISPSARKFITCNSISYSNPLLGDVLAITGWREREDEAIGLRVSMNNECAVSAIIWCDLQFEFSRTSGEWKYKLMENEARHLLRKIWINDLACLSRRMVSHTQINHIFRIVSVVISVSTQKKIKKRKTYNCQSFVSFASLKSATSDI